MKIPFKKAINWTGLAVMLITTVVYYFSAERTGSLWDCGEFIAGATKLEVVHPPGAPLFLLIGRFFTMFAELFSSNPEVIAFSVNFLSGIATAGAAMLICWVTMYLGKLALVGREDAPSDADTMALMAAGLVAGLTTAFATSIWFSAVEGEVYAMSTFFTTLTLWATVKWYYLPNEKQNDRWLIFAVYAAGLSIGVHLLSILTFPALALFYYFKKYKNHNFLGVIASVGAGLGFMIFVQKIVLVGIPTLWSWFDLVMVNSFGLPVNSGVIPLVLLLIGVFFFAFNWATKTRSELGQKLIVSAALVVIGFSTLGIVVIRANANTPINMNNPNNPFQLITYLNREQYGERPLLYGPHFDAPVTSTDVKERYALDGDKYRKIDKKITPKYNNKEKMFMPRMGHADDTRRSLYRRWMNLNPDPSVPLPPGRPNMADNISFFVKYQLRWMYMRYFMWNFSGKQNGDQGYYPWDKSSGNWISGIPFIDNARLYNQAELTETMVNHEGRNKYYMLPFLFGLIGLFFHFTAKRKDFLAILALFIITGIGIIVYSNQPPNEPRERDYVFAGSFFTYAIWVGMGVLGMYKLFASQYIKMGAKMAAPIAGALVMIAPLLMGFQNFDDHSRKDHKASRDYAANFLNSVEPNAILFTYGDNDTYPLWYAQEVEGIRTDVRVVNLSLIAVDWYIDQLRRKVNNSPAIKMTIPQDAIRGYKRSQYFIDPFKKFQGRSIALNEALKFAAATNEVPLQSGDKMESYWPSKKVYIPVRKSKAYEMGMISRADSAQIADRMEWNINKGNFLYKGDAAILDIINSNLWERPIYFAVTCQQSSMLGIQQYTQLEGLALRIVPKKSAGDSMYGMIGNGDCASDIIYENIMEKFAWGGFDKKKLFVDRSYTPSVQTTKVLMLRACADLLAKGKKDECVDLLDKHFEAFPHMNFPYDNNTMAYLSMYAQAGQIEKAKPHIRILAAEFADIMKFHRSLDTDELEQSFSQDSRIIPSYSKQLLDFVKAQGKDEALTKEISDLLNPYLGGS